MQVVEKSRVKKADLRGEEADLKGGVTLKGNLRVVLRGEASLMGDQRRGAVLRGEVIVDLEKPRSARLAILITCIDHSASGSRR